MPLDSRKHYATIMRNGEVIVRDHPIAGVDPDAIEDAALRLFASKVGRPGCYRLQVRGPRVTLSLTEDVVAPAPAGQQTPWRKVPSFAMKGGWA